MLRLGLTIATGLHRLFDYTPAGLIAARVRTRQGLKWGVPAMGLGVLCLLLAATLTTVIDQGGPGWLNLLVIVLIIEGLRLLTLGPVSLAQLARALVVENRAPWAKCRH
jgi:hypothetical protein